MEGADPIQDATTMEGAEPIQGAKAGEPHMTNLEEMSHGIKQL